MRKHLEFLNSNITKARHSALLVGLFVLAACSDSPTAPQQSIDRVAAARVIPSVTDARMRLAPAIANVAVQQRVSYDLGELENALTNGDGERARFHLRVVGSVLADYRMQQGSTTKDGADVTAIVLMLNVVSPVIDARYELPVQQ
jgi:hypothetical protein